MNSVLIPQNIIDQPGTYGQAQPLVFEIENPFWMLLGIVAAAVMFRELACPFSSVFFDLSVQRTGKLSKLPSLQTSHTLFVEVAVVA